MVTIVQNRLRAKKPYTSRGTRVKTRIYVWPENETVLENLIERSTRPIKAYREVVNQALNDLGVDQSKLDIKWTRKAGCQCGCSPGFVVDGWNEKLHGMDLHVTFRG